MFKVRMLKLKTEVETYLAKLCGAFNKRIRGIKIKYNRNYCGDRHKYHDLDIMFSNDIKMIPHVVEGHDVDIMFTKDSKVNAHVVGEHDLDIMYSNNKMYSQVVEGHDLDVMYSKDGNVNSPDTEKHDVDVMRGKNVAEKPCVLYMHGGGWCAYDKRVFRSTCKRLCACGTVVFNCNFRLAPKFSVEDMQQDIYAIVDYISSNARRYGGDPEKIILAGDSAGAHLLSLFINKAILNNEEVAKKVVGCAFFYGVYNLETALGTGFKHLQTYMSSIVPPSTPNYRDRLQEISPVNYISGNVPPTLICSGKVDKLNDTQSQQYAQLLRENGVEVKTLIFPKEFTAAKHKFITFDTNEAAKRSFAAFGEFIKTL